MTGCPCDAWGREIARNPPTLLYVAPLFGKYIPNGLVSLSGSVWYGGLESYWSYLRYDVTVERWG